MLRRAGLFRGRAQGKKEEDCADNRETVDKQKVFQCPRLLPNFFWLHAPKVLFFDPALIATGNDATPVELAIFQPRDDACFCIGVGGTFYVGLSPECGEVCLDDDVPDT